MLALLDEFRQRTGVSAVIGGIVSDQGALALDVTGSCRRDRPMERATVEDSWHIGSCGKAMTAVLYGRLVEIGLAEWDTSIGDLFPDLSDISPDWDGPTIDDLLRCRAGVAPNPTRAQMMDSWTGRLPPTEQRTEASRIVLTDSPKNPGRFRYSNLGYVLAGAAIDRIAGMPFEKALTVHVLQPLGIESLGFGPPPRVCGHRARLQLGPMAIGAGTPAAPGSGRGDNPVLLTPAGRMHLTIADWGRFQRLFLNRGRPLLEPETIRRLLAIPEVDRGSMAMGWASGDGLGASYAMQGSNTFWAATALIDKDMTRTAMIVANDGRTGVLRGSALLARDLLKLPAE